VLECASGFIKSAAMFNADKFGGGDLHVIDVSAVPQRFDHAVGEAKYHQILDSFLTEVMVDAENLLFSEDLLELFVQLLRGREVGTKRLFHDHARPLAVFFLGKANFTELFNDQREKFKRNREV